MRRTHRMPWIYNKHAMLTVTACLSMAAAISFSGYADAETALTRSYKDYVAPPVSLLAADGKATSFADLVDGSRPVVLEFFYTSCTTICGMQASTLALARKELGPRTLLVSVTIDPEYDTPARLKQYSGNFKAGPNWRLLTGRRGDIQRVLTAFEARPYGDNKMLHRPITFIRPAKGRQWVRLDGLATAKQIVGEYKDAVGKPPPASSTFNSIHESLNRFIG